jgi:hypothetical protein
MEANELRIRLRQFLRQMDPHPVIWDKIALKSLLRKKSSQIAAKRQSETRIQSDKASIESRIVQR